MKTRLFIIIGTVAMLTAIFFILGIPEDSRDAENPNECWFQDSDGKMKPCVIETEPSFATDCPIMTHKFDPSTQSCEIW